MSEQADVKVFGSKEGNATTCSMEQIRNFVKQLRELELEMEGTKKKIKDLIADFTEEYSIPKKEISAARRMLKSDIDPDITSEIYANIADLQ